MLDENLDRNVINFPSSNTSEISTLENANKFESPAFKARFLRYAKGTNLIHENLAKKYILVLSTSMVEVEAIARDMLKSINEVEYYIEQKNIFELDITLNNNISKLYTEISFVNNIINKHDISSKDKVENILFRLSYIQRYLAMNLRLDYIISENSEFLSEHLLRITYYIHELMVSSRKLCEIVIAEINSRVPGRGGDNLSLDRHRDKNKY